MSHPRQFQMVGGSNNPPGHYNDTTFTKIFVGGLAWETQRDTMRRYFEQFGEILEAVVITDKNTGRSKGYGFVTFKDPEAAMRACQNPSPVIDGRRANCNLASLGANKNRPPTPQHGTGRFRQGPGGLVATTPAYHGSSSSTFFHQPSGQYTFPYSTYGYSGYSQDTMYPMNYYNVYGGQQFSPYYPSSGASGPPGLVHNIYPFYAQYAHTSSQAQGFGLQYPHQMLQFPFLSHQHYAGSTGILSFPSSSMPLSTTTTSADEMYIRVPFKAIFETKGTEGMKLTVATSTTNTGTTTTTSTTVVAAAATGAGDSSQTSGTVSEQKSST